MKKRGNFFKIDGNGGWEERWGLKVFARKGDIRQNVLQNNCLHKI